MTAHVLKLLAALVMSLGIASAGYFVGQTLYNSEVAVNTADVRGLAEWRVRSDRAYWTIRFTVTGQAKDSIPSLYAKSESDQNKIVDLLMTNGFSSEEIIPGVTNYHKEEYRDNTQRVVELRHVLAGAVVVQTDSVDKVAAARAKMNKLIAEGLDLQNESPSYRYTKLNEIKPAMLKEATFNARTAANEFATNAGVTVGGIRRARQGNFVIRDAGESYGDTQKIEKDVRVVTSVTFFLTDE